MQPWFHCRLSCGRRSKAGTCDCSSRERLHQREGREAWPTTDVDPMCRTAGAAGGAGRGNCFTEQEETVMGRADVYLQPEAADPVLSSATLLAIAEPYTGRRSRVLEVDESGGEARAYLLDGDVVVKT